MCVIKTGCLNACYNKQNSLALPLIGTLKSMEPLTDPLPPITCLCTAKVSSLHSHHTLNTELQPSQKSGSSLNTPFWGSDQVHSLCMHVAPSAAHHWHDLALTVIVKQTVDRKKSESRSREHITAVHLTCVIECSLPDYGQVGGLMLLVTALTRSLSENTVWKELPD
jgi:hypothetical protein